MADEWGPWIEHDGRGCPVRGHIVEARWLLYDGKIEKDSSCGRLVWLVSSDAGLVPDSSWVWEMVDGIPTCKGIAAPIIRYRVRKPRGMELIEAALQTEPCPKQPERVE